MRKNGSLAFQPQPIVAALFALLSLPFCLFAQTQYRAVNANVTVAGTSTLHDWKETSSKGSANAVFVINSNKVSGLNQLVFTIPAKSLKSESSSMDNNTYKALKADKNPDITYKLSSATVTEVNPGTYTINSKGKLTIAGTTRETDVVATAKLNADHSLSVSGSKKFNMTDYNISPPKVMMMKTGNEINISYNLKFTQ